MPPKKNTVGGIGNKGEVLARTVLTLALVDRPGLREMKQCRLGLRVQFDKGLFETVVPKNVYGPLKLCMMDVSRCECGLPILRLFHCFLCEEEC